MLKYDANMISLVTQHLTEAQEAGPADSVALISAELISAIFLAIFSAIYSVEAADAAEPIMVR